MGAEPGWLMCGERGAGVAGAWGARSQGAGAWGERGRMEKWAGPGRIHKLGAYIPRPRPRNIRSHLMFLSYLIQLRNISCYVPRGSDLDEEHKDPPYIPRPG
jgi:hypothetical protein